MAKIKPFQAVVYNQNKVKNLKDVVCPPYDVISPQKQQEYIDLNPYNLTHILLGKDSPGKDRYQKAEEYFRQWLKEGIFIQEKKPAIFFYSHQYNIRGEKKTRLGFIALLHLGDNCSSPIGHEHTRSAAKEDRMRIINATHANLSPIFIVFLDKKRIIQHLYQTVIPKNQPFLTVTDDEKGTHTLWKIDAPEIIADIQAKTAAEDVFIADGHHRYEVACAYREQLRQKTTHLAEEDPSNYILAYFTNTDIRGLTILPIHRLVKTESPLDTESFIRSISTYFDVEEIKDKTRFFFLLQKAGKSEHVLGMYTQRKYWLFRLKNVKVLEKLISEKPLEYRTLDVSILNSIVFQKVMQLELENTPALTYSPDIEEVLMKVDSDPSYAAFFLNPVKIQQIIDVARKGEKMPAKSTYFYPKVLSGLTIHKLD